MLAAPTLRVVAWGIGAPANERRRGFTVEHFNTQVEVMVLCSETSVQIPAPLSL